MSVVSETRDALKHFSDWLKTTPWREKADCIDGWIKKLDEPCVIAVSGLVKAGKSSFINALLGEDLTVVGECETTATINKIRYSGVKRDESHAVRCCWSDGRTEWRDREFLRAMQGKDPLTLQTASKIDCLEFFVDNPFLSQVSIIDTPGYGASTEGNAHEETLRKWHAKQTMDCTIGADAVIFLLDAGTSNFTDTDIEFLTGSDKKSIFSRDHVIFLLSKSDKLDEERRKRQTETLRKRLGECVPDLRGAIFLPMSAGVQRIIDSMSDTEFQTLFSDIKAKLSDEDDICLDVPSMFPECTERLADLKKRCSTQWNVAQIVVRSILSSENCLQARTKLEAMSGFSGLRKELDRIFFERTSVLRCSRFINAALNMIHGLQDHDIGKYRGSKERFVRCLPKLKDVITQLKMVDDDSATFLSTMIDAEQINYQYEPRLLENGLIEQERNIERLINDDSTLHQLDVRHSVREVFAANKERFEALAAQAGLGISDFEEVDDIARNFAAYKGQNRFNAAEKAQSWDYYKDMAGDAAFGEFARLASQLYRYL